MRRRGHRFRQWLKAAGRREPEAFDAYERFSSYPAFVVGLLFLAAFIITLDSQSTPDDRAFAVLMMQFTWVAFGLDYLLGLLISPNRISYVKHHVVLLAALIFPPIRLLMLGHVFHVLRARPLRSGDRARSYLLYLTTLLLVFSSVLVVYFERSAPNSNIRSFGDALWWGGETVSTVGYGDFYPVTLGGRLVAGVLFFNGVALLSVITAGLAQRFTVSDARAEDERMQETEAADSTASTTEMVSISKHELETLQTRITTMQHALSTIGTHVEDLMLRTVSDLEGAGATATASQSSVAGATSDQPEEGAARKET